MINIGNPVPADLAPTMDLDGRRGFIERREGNRHISVFRVGRLACDGHDQLCVIRNISVGGVMIEVNAPPPVGARIRVELRSDRSLAATVRWARERSAGVAFDAPIDVAAMLKEERSSILRMQPRAPRFVRDAGVQVTSTLASMKGRIGNISINGLAMTGPTPFSPNERVLATIEGLGAIHAVVRWSANGETGLRFAAPLSYRALADWLDDRMDA